MPRLNVFCASSLHELIRVIATLQTHGVDSTLKRRGNARSRLFNVESMWCVCREGGVEKLGPTVFPQ